MGYVCFMEHLTYTDQEPMDVLFLFLKGHARHSVLFRCTTVLQISTVQDQDSVVSLRNFSSKLRQIIPLMEDL